MRHHWTREDIIRQLLEREAQGLPLTVGEKGVAVPLYQAARRTFGSWPNALQAAGIARRRVLICERWAPRRILAMIRRLARRRRPLTSKQMERRYRNLVSSARRHFGSWTRAVLAAGVEPTKLQRVVTWNSERVIEAILTRALRNESLVARLVEPRSLVDAGQRFYGGWPAAVAAAGLAPALTVLPPRRRKRRGEAECRVPRAKSSRRRRMSWTKERVVAALLARVREQNPITPKAIADEDHPLYRAMQRHLGSWDKAMAAAGLDPSVYRRGSATASPTATGEPHGSVTRQSQADEKVRPDLPASEA